MPVNSFLFLGLKGFNNLGCSIIRAFFLSEDDILKFEKMSFELLGSPKKSSGNIFFDGFLYIKYYIRNNI